MIIVLGQSRARSVQAHRGARRQVIIENKRFGADRDQHASYCRLVMLAAAEGATE